LTRRILTNEIGKPKKVIIFSRDEAKQNDMRLSYQNKSVATDEVIYNNFKELVEFRIGDVRDFHSVASALISVDIVFNAAALKQVPSCEYFPYEAVLTNITGPENIVRAIGEPYVSQRTLHLRSLRQCPGIQGIGYPALSQSNQGRRAGDLDDTRNDPFLVEP
jgi:UDP-glucose 4-epimerase